MKFTYFVRHSDAGRDMLNQLWWTLFTIIFYLQSYHSGYPRKMQLDADWSHRGAQDWTGTTLTLEICLLLFLFKSLLVALELLLVVPWCLQKLAQTLSFFKILCYWHSKIQIKLQKLPIGLKFHVYKLTLCPNSLNSSKQCKIDLLYE